MMNDRFPHNSLIQFLQSELAVSEDAIATALKHPERETAPLHMILWQYGLVSNEQLNTIFDWVGEQNAIAVNKLLETV